MSWLIRFEPIRLSQSFLQAAVGSRQYPLLAPSVRCPQKV